MLSADLKPFWHKLDMPTLRAQAKAAIDQDMRIGILDSWKQVEGMILPFPRGDVSLEGEELEASLPPGEPAFDEETDEETDIEDAVDADPLPISDAAAAVPAAHPLRPDPSLTSDAPSSAPDPSPTAHGQEQEAQRQRLSNYKAMLEAVRAFKNKDPGLTNYLENRIHDEEKLLHQMEPGSAEAVFYHEGAAKHDAALEELIALQEEVRQADKEKLEERRAKRATATRPQGKTADKWQVLSHLMPLPDAVQLQIETEAARRSSLVSDRTSKKEKVKAKAKKKQERKAAKAKAKAKKKQERKDAKAKAKKEKMEKAKARLGKGVLSKGKGKEPTKGKRAENAEKAATPRVSDLTPKGLVLAAKERAETIGTLGFDPEVFAAEDFGAGHPDGGSPEHKLNRLQVLCHLKLLSESKGAKFSAQSLAIWDDFLAWQEQKWMREFQSAPTQLGTVVRCRLCRWWSEILTGKIRSFADEVDARTELMRKASA